MPVVELPLKVDSLGNIRMPATIINTKNKKSIQINLLPDTAATFTTLDRKFARQLGINDVSVGGKPASISQGGGTNQLFQHALNIKVGSLSPFTTIVQFPSKDVNTNFPMAILGIATLFQFDKVTYTGTGKIRFEQNTVPTIQKQAAYADAYRSFYGYPRWYRKRI